MVVAKSTTVTQSVQCVSKRTATEMRDHVHAVCPRSAAQVPLRPAATISTMDEVGPQGGDISY